MGSSWARPVNTSVESPFRLDLTVGTVETCCQVASRVAPQPPPSSEPKFYGYEEHGVRVCERELVPHFLVGNGDAYAVSKPARQP